MFYLGTHEINWLNKVDIPLFISHRRLMKRKGLPRATCSWALDSGGFSELFLFGEWRTKPIDYVRATRRYTAEVGNLQWAAIQDYMCEPFMIQKTGLTLAIHQERTIDSYIELMSLDDSLPWAPVLQGWVMADYLDHVEQYAKRGIDLTQFSIVCAGSMCRRQATQEAEAILRVLNEQGIRLHGLGFKIDGLIRSNQYLTSSDSMAWSYKARRSQPLPGHTHKSCANCREFALTWRTELLDKLERESTKPRMRALL